MKFFGEHISGSGKTVYDFTIGKVEAEILHSILWKYSLMGAPTIETQQFWHRVKGMVNELKKVVKPKRRDKEFNKKLRDLMNQI